MSVKLNLGCGSEPMEGYINIDIQEPCDLKHDLRKSFLFDDNSVDEIFAEDNFICLFTLKEWMRIKKEITRVLKPGGKIEIIFLDFEYILKAFLDNKDGKRWGWWRQTIFSAQRNEYDFSKNGFTYDKLISDLSEENITNFSTKPSSGQGYIHLVGYKYKPKTDKTMRILIGTPIHICKDYSMERWIENVSKSTYPVDLLLMDNSPNAEYIERAREYCVKYNIKNYKIEHIDVWQPNGVDYRKGLAREAIRQYVLSHNYDAWFSWESDQIIPVDTLEKLAGIMEKGNFTMINPNSWKRESPADPDAGFGCALIRKDSLEKYGFLLEYPDMPRCWAGSERWFKKRVLKGGGNYIEIFGAIGPIYHLKE